MNISTFEDMKLDDATAGYLHSKKYIKPTPIQCKAYEEIINKKDFIGCSPTGTGKTLAYILPVLNMIDNSSSEPQAIIVSPTYELNRQIHSQLAAICKNINIKSQLINGDGNLVRQIEYLKKKPQIIVGSIGRIKQLTEMKKIKCHKMQILIMDEADKLLNKNALESTMAFRKCLLKYCQTCVFSASMDEKAVKQALQLMNNEVITVNFSKNFNACARIPDTITHIYVLCERNMRIETTRSICAAIKPKKCMIFTNNKFELVKAFEKLSYHGYNIDCLSGNSSKNSRTMAVADFTANKLQYLISTDIASRGLHFEGVTHIINLQLPQENNEYLHRAGRCGRNNQKGFCISLVTANELKHIKGLEKRFKIQFKQAILKKGEFIYE